VGLQHEEGVGGEELIGQDHQLPLVTSLGRYSLKHDRMSSWIALATFWILDLTSEKCGFASAAPNGLKDQHIHTWLSISVGPEHLVFEGQ
jgi:hypothetical protein